MVRCTDGRSVGGLSYDLPAMADVGATDLLVRIRHRDLFRLRHLQLKAESAENRRRDRLVALAENCGSHLDCVRHARLDPLAGTLSHGLHSRAGRHCYRTSRVHPRVESGRPPKFGCTSLRSYTCAAFNDGNTRRAREIVAETWLELARRHWENASPTLKRQQL